MNKGNVTRKSSGILSDILRENDVIEGCSSFGEGLSRAVSLYMMKNISTIKKPTKGNKLDNTNKVQTDDQELEDSFYVIDIGVIVTQFYQCK